MVVTILFKSHLIDMKEMDLRSANPFQVSEIKSFPLFQGFDQEHLSKLCAEGIVLSHQHRDLLFEFGDPALHFGVVLSGAYKLSRLTQAGEDSVIHFCSPGDVIAALVMPQPRPLYPVSVRAMGPSRVLILKREVYLQQWLPTPQLVARIQGLLSTRMGRFQNQKIMQRAPLPAKVAALLLQLVAKGQGDEMEVPLPLTRKEIADTLGVTVESVIRVMSDWAKRGLISTTDRHIRILQPESLIREVEQDPEI